jgi:acetyltransferase-like isoleucine patch superfamily enzyme
MYCEMKSVAMLLRRATRGVLYRFYNLIVPLWLALLGVRFLGKSQFVGFPEVTLVTQSYLAIGEGGLFISSSFSTALGVSHPLTIRTMADGAEIRIGKNVGISGGSLCAAKAITIGDDCLLGADVIVCDTDFHPICPDSRRNPKQAFNDAKPVKIGKNVFLGTRTMVLKGVTIGDNSVIGAGSVVTKDIPENVLAAGNPCRVIRSLFQENTA